MEEVSSGPELIPLRRAVLCLDCEQISAAQNGHCPGCGSQAVFSLAGALRSDERSEARTMGEAELEFLAMLRGLLEGNREAANGGS
jgi:hypothetical protein